MCEQITGQCTSLAMPCGICELYTWVCVHVPPVNLCSALLLLGAGAVELQLPLHWIQQPLALFMHITTLWDSIQCLLIHHKCFKSFCKGNINVFQKVNTLRDEIINGFENRLKELALENLHRMTFSMLYFLGWALQTWITIGFTSKCNKQFKIDYKYFWITR